MTKITAAIIDDELAASENIQILLNNYCPEIEIVGMAHSIPEGIKLIKNRQPQLIFLDISMPPEGTGFDLLEMFPNRNFHVIFVTAHSEYSLKAIKQHAFDYLLKPIDYRELIRSVQQYQEMIPAKNSTEKTPVKAKSITLSTDQGIYVIDPNTVYYCKASGSYTEFHIQNRAPIVISKPLKFAEELLNGINFKRVHRSYLINTSLISKFTKEDGGYVYINNESIPVSKKYFENLYDLLN